MKPFFDCVTSFLLADKKPEDMSDQNYVDTINEEMGYSDNLKLQKADVVDKDDMLKKMFKVGFNAISGMSIIAGFIYATVNTISMIGVKSCGLWNPQFVMKRKL